MDSSVELCLHPSCHRTKDGVSSASLPKNKPEVSIERKFINTERTAVIAETESVYKNTYKDWEWMGIL